MTKLSRSLIRLKTFLNFLFRVISYGSFSSLKNYSIIYYRGAKFFFINSNKILRYRINSFKTKEPETLKWIESFDKKTSFWDIGSNIGEFAIFASKIKNCDVVAFEPSFANLNTLAKNIYINNVQDKVSIFPIALNEKNKIGMLKSSNLNPGHATSSFGNGLGNDGKPIKVNFEYRTLSFSLDKVIEEFCLKEPDYIKIDVDGNEHLVLSGAQKTLKKVREILIELPGDWREQTEISHKILKDSGFTQIKKHNFDRLTNPNVSANEIWSRTKNN
jgi:FkbM family methyltransferase